MDYKSIFIKIIEKQTPKKPTNIYNDGMIIHNYPEYEYAKAGSCPICGNDVKGKHKYCHECGQALDWSDIK